MYYSVTLLRLKIDRTILNFAVDAICDILLFKGMRGIMSIANCVVRYIACTAVASLGRRGVNSTSMFARLIKSSVFYQGGIVNNKRGRAEVGHCHIEYDDLHSVCRMAEEKAYNVDATAEALSFSVLEGLAKGLERSQLVQLLGLEFDWPMVGDVKGIHPPSLDAPRTLVVHVHNCPFLNAGTSNDCCTGSILGRSGHATVTMPCYRTDIPADSTVCPHCNELWAFPDEDNMCKLDVATMPKAAEFYKAGKTGVMRKWPEMLTAKEAFEREIQSAKDLFEDSPDALPSLFPEVDFDGFCNCVLNDAEVLFADAGRSKNPYKRSAEQQARIGAYVLRMVVLFIRVRAAVPQVRFNPFVVKLRAVARRVEDAAKWSAQRAFPEYPVFVGPIVAADIMLAGFGFAEKRYHHQVSRVMQDLQEPRDESILDFGPVVRAFDEWARAVKPARRVSPMKLSKRQQRAVSKKGEKLWEASSSVPDAETARRLDLDSDASIRSSASKQSQRSRDSGSSVDMRAAPAEFDGRQIFYGVGHGKKPGVYTSWDVAQQQVHNFSGFRVRRFRSRASAEKYVAAVKAEPRTTWYVLKNSNRDGAYESRETAEAFQSADSVLVERSSLAAAKRFLGRNRIRVFREEEPEQTSKQPVSEEAAEQNKFFAVRGGSQNGVYLSLNDVFTAMRRGGGEFEVFDSQSDAAEYCAPVATAEPASSAMATETMFVVWAGKSTGVMNAEDCLAATKGVRGAAVEGPMPWRAAFQMWSSGKRTAEPAASKSSKQPAAAAASQVDEGHASSSAEAEAPTIEQPSDAEWEEAVSAGKKAVFACKLLDGRRRIAFSEEGASEGDVTLTVRTFDQEDTLFLNFAKAEQSFSEQRSISEQLAAARKTIAKKGQTGSAAKKPAAKAAASAASVVATASTGQSPGSRVGMSGVVHTREVSQIRRCFIDAGKAIVIKPAPAEPDEDELERDLPAPGSSTYVATDVESNVGEKGKEVSLMEYFSFKKSKVNAWPLKSFSEFLSFCRQAQRLCIASSKSVGAANAAVFTELLDIAVRVHMQMSRRGTLGNNEIRFKIRMFMHLQYATNYRVLHVGGPAMRAFEAAVDTFGASRVPQFRNLKNKNERKFPRTARFCAEVDDSSAVQIGRPATGCYLCPATDHYASNLKFHPRDANGKRKKVSPEDKKAIMARIETADRTPEEKAFEKTQVKQYWVRHAL